MKLLQSPYFFRRTCSPPPLPTGILYSLQFRSHLHLRSHGKIGDCEQSSGSSSEDNLLDESDSNLVNLYDSDVENSVVPVEHSGLRPYRFEPRRVELNEQRVSSKTI